MDSLVQDIRFALRSLIKRPLLTCVAVVALALGIGFNTAIFSVINGVLLRDLPYPQPQELAMIWNDNRQLGWEEDLTSYPNFLDWRERSESFASMAGFTSFSVNLTGDGEPMAARGVAVGEGFFSLLEVDPADGRTFAAEEFITGQDEVVVLSDRLWRSRYGSDPELVGSTIQVNETPHIVVGIMPPGFNFPAGVKDFPRRVDLWMPLALSEGIRNARLALWMYVVGRLEDGASMERAKVEMRGIGEQLAEEFPDSNAAFGVNVTPLTEHMVGKVRAALLLLLGAVTFVLLIACANVANLLLARAAGREHEISVRSAMGAGKVRLLRQLLVESTVLALLGGGAGLLLAAFGIDLLLALQPAELPRLDQIALDGRILLFTLGISLLTGLTFGLAPALVGSRPDLNSLLKEGGGGRSGGGTRGRRLRSALVVAEVALSLTLLIAAGLTLRSLQRLHGVDPGFRTQEVVTLDVSFRSQRYRESSAAVNFVQELQQKVAALPGVKSAALTSDILLGDFPNTTVIQLEGEPPVRPEERQEIILSVVTPGFFSTLEIPVEGREFELRDATEAPLVAMVNRAMVEKRWRGKNPIGTRFQPGGSDDEDPWVTVVGVVGDTKRGGLDRSPEPELYLPHTQRPFRGMVLTARTEGPADLANLAPALRTTLWSLDDKLPVAQVQPLAERLAETAAQRHFYTLLLGLFAAVALILSGIGLYGVLSYHMTQRRREIGIRMALGAGRGEILREGVGRGLGLALLGVALGLPLALAATRFLESLLFETTVGDPATLAAVAALLVAIAALASYLPSLRATRLDPMTVLGSE